MDRWIPACVAAVLCGGCMTFSTLKTARALDPGETESAFSLPPEILLSEARPGGSASLTAMQFELAERWGVARGVDVGVKFSLAGIEGDTTLQLVRSRVVDVALEPGLGLNYLLHAARPNALQDGDFWMGALYLPLLVGLNFGRGSQFFFGPQVVGTLLAADGVTLPCVDPNACPTEPSTGGYGGADVLAGGTVGFSIQVTPGFRVAPEVDVLDVAYADGARRGLVVPFQPGQVVVQAALGFGFDKGGHRAW